MAIGIVEYPIEVELTMDKIIEKGYGIIKGTEVISEKEHKITKVKILEDIEIA